MKTPHGVYSRGAYKGYRIEVACLVGGSLTLLHV